MTMAIEPVTAPPVAAGTSISSAAQRPKSSAATFEAALDAVTGRGADSTALHAPRSRAPSTTGETFEATVLVPLIAAMLPPEDAEIWGGTGGALWRGVFADALATDVARSGGIGIAPLVDRMIARGRAVTHPPSTKEGDPA
jgi:hypothetical protein